MGAVMVYASELVSYHGRPGLGGKDLQGQVRSPAVLPSPLPELLLLLFHGLVRCRLFVVKAVIFKHEGGDGRPGLGLPPRRPSRS